MHLTRCASTLPFSASSLQRESVSSQVVESFWMIASKFIKRKLKNKNVYLRHPSTYKTNRNKTREQQKCYFLGDSQSMPVALEYIYLVLGEVSSSLVQLHSNENSSSMSFSNFRYVRESLPSSFQICT